MTFDPPQPAIIVAADGTQHRVIVARMLRDDAMPPQLPTLEWVDCTHTAADVTEIAAIIAEHGACEVEVWAARAGALKVRHKTMRYFDGGRDDDLFFEMVDAGEQSIAELYWKPSMRLPYHGGTRMTRTIIGHQRRRL